MASDLPRTADVVVVGAGIAGASTGWALARLGQRVVVVEAEPAPGTHATGRSAALLMETYGGPVIRGLVRASRPLFSEPPEGFADHPLTSARGTLWIADEAHAEGLQADAAAWSGVEVLDADGARQLVPRLRPEAAAVAVHEPGALDLDVDALLHGYLRGLRADGGILAIGCPASSISSDGRGGWTVETPAGSVGAPVVVDAAGAWGDEVARLAGVRPLGLRPLRRTAFLFRPPDGVETRRWPLVCDVADRFYVKPDAGMLLGSPADTTPSEPCDARPDEVDVARAIDHIEAALDLEVRGVRAPWAGLRTFCPDGVPAVGRDPEHPGFVWVVGQGGYGIKTSPAMAWAAAAAALDDLWPEALAAEGVTRDALDPARFR